MFVVIFCGVLYVGGDFFVSNFIQSVFFSLDFSSGGDPSRQLFRSVSMTDFLVYGFQSICSVSRIAVGC